MEQSPSLEAKSPSANQEIPLILWNLKVYNRIHNGPPDWRIQNIYTFK
jgi:hypothetical protein